MKFRMAKTSISKEYKAPIDKVWEALTTPDHILKFWAPPGMETVEASISKLEKSGEFRYSMKNEQFQQWVKCVYERVEPKTFLSFMEVLVDQDGNEVPASYYGMPGDEIKHSLTELELEEVGDKTKLTMTFDYGDDMANKFASGGWKGMIENLANVVE